MLIATKADSDLTLHGYSGPGASTASLNPHHLEGRDFPSLLYRRLIEVKEFAEDHIAGKIYKTMVRSRALTNATIPGYLHVIAVCNRLSL